jgi:hypothetical protein
VSQLALEQLHALLEPVRSQDHLRRIVDEIERLHRIVFHSNEHAEWERVRASAEQIVVADIVMRRQGQADAVFYALRALENGGKSWDAAIAEMAAGMHSYFTTPLGIVMRLDLFGDQAIFVTPDAYDWVRHLRQPGATGPGVHP